MQKVEADLVPGEMDRLVEEIAARRVDPYTAAEDLVRRILK